MECSAKNIFLRFRVNQDKILIVSNNNKTKAITIKMLRIFILFQVHF